MTAFRQRVLLVVAAVAAPCAAAQPELPASDTEERILAHLQEIETLRGINAAEAIAHMTALADIYQENGAHDLAIGILDQARGIVSANYGLHSLDEALLLQMTVQSVEAIGNFQVAWDLEQEALAIAARYPGNLRTYPLYREIAGKRADVLEDYHGGGFPPQIVLGCYYNPYRSFSGPNYGTCRSGSRGVLIEALRREITVYYRLALNALILNNASQDEISSLLAEVLPVVYRGDARLNLSGAFGLLRNEGEISVSSQRRAETLLQIADWNAVLLHERGIDDNELLLEQYAEAYAELTKAGMDQASIDAIFAPSMPVVLPAFVPNPLASEQAAGSTGHIDVAFDVTKHGRAENIAILDAPKSVTRRAKNELVTLIEESAFRPRTTNGQFAQSSHVKVRYYVTITTP
jgi:tetratricopeptide (TPR) repeat protein